MVNNHAIYMQWGVFRALNLLSDVVDDVCFNSTGNSEAKVA